MSLLEIIARRSKVDPAQFSLPSLLAEQALARVADRPKHRFNRMIAECLAAELLREGPSTATSYAQELLDHGVPEEMVLNTYIAGAADHLGRAWEEDDLSFSQVTHAMGQLMQVTRKVASTPATAPFLRPDRPRVLLMRTPGEEHILGLLLAAQDMRRAGWLVRVDLSGEIAALAATTGAQEFDLIGLTAAEPARLEALVATIQSGRKAQPKANLIVGGGLVTHHLDVAERAGADLLVPRGPKTLKSISEAFDFGEI